MFDLITIGDVTIDLFFKGEGLTEENDRFHLAIGGKYQAQEFHMSLGGSAANVAAGATYFGMSCACIAKIGENPFKQIIIQKLASKNIATNMLLLQHDFINISNILLAQNGDKTVVHYITKTSHMPISAYEQFHGNTKALYVGNLPDVPVSQRLNILNKAKKSNIVIFLSVSASDCEKYTKDVLDCISVADVCIINAYEFSHLAKKDKEKIDFSQNIAEQYLKKKQGLLVVTDGKNGSYAYEDKTVYKQNAVLVDTVVDCTGAGDAFTSGFIATYVSGGTVQQALQNGSAYAADKISHIGAQ